MSGSIKEAKIFYPNESAKEWADKWGIVMDTSPCGKCGEQQSFVIPFSYRSFRGLKSDHIKCGKEYQQSKMITTDKRFNEGIKFSFEERNKNNPSGE